MSADTVGRWELGVSKPSLFYQQKLCVLFGTSAAELGLIELLPPPPERLPAVASRRQQGAPAPFPSAFQPIGLLAETPGLAPEELLGAWLAAGAADLSALCAEGWTLEEVLSSLQVVLKGVQAMPNVSRRQLLQLGAALLQAQARLTMGDMNGSLEVVGTAVPLVVAADSTLLDRGLIDQIEQLTTTFPRNVEVREIANEVQRHPRLCASHAQQSIPRYLEAKL
jgi:hypothetical protein